MKQITISPVDNQDSVVMVVITDSNRKNEKSWFYCPLSCVQSIINVNFNFPF